MKKALLAVALLAAAIVGTTSYFTLQANASTEAAATPHVSALVAGTTQSRFGLSPVNSGVQELARNEGLPIVALRKLAVTSGGRHATILGA